MGDIVIEESQNMLISRATSGCVCCSGYEKLFMNQQV